MSRQAKTDHPVHDLIASRWSPYGFSGQAVADADLRSLFEAARWAASSYNEQPWSYIVATREDAAGFDGLLSCLVEPNRAWARHAPVLALGVAHMRFSRNDKPNRHAWHDLGLASGQLTLEATARGLVVHQMAGILPDRARELYAIPDGWEAVTALAIGYAGQNPELPEALRQRDQSARSRKPLAQFVFGDSWGRAAKVL